MNMFPLPPISTMKRAFLDKPRAKNVIVGIFAAMDAGAYFDRAKIVTRFIDGGYGANLAERYADELIAANTDIKHHTRWTIWGAGDKATYNFG